MVQVADVIVAPVANRPTKPVIGSLRDNSAGERNAITLVSQTEGVDDVTGRNRHVLFPVDGERHRRRVY